MWLVGGVKVCGIEVGLVIPVTAFCGMDSMDPGLLCVCVQVYLTLVSLCPCRNVAIQGTAPSQGYPTPLNELSPSCPLPQINTHMHTHTQHPPPGEQQELALGDYGEGKKSFQEDSHLLLSCCRPWAGKKTPLFLPLSPFLAMPAKKLGRAAL